MEVAELNIIAIAIAAIAGMALGALWYSPVLFGNAWMAAIGKSQEDLGSPTPAMIGSMGCCLLAAIAMAIVIEGLQVDSLISGVVVGAVCGVGFVATAMLSDSLFCGWGRKLYYIQAGYRVTYMIVMGAIIGAWPT